MKDYTLIGRFAFRIAEFAAAMRHAHEFSSIPGDIDEPWSLQFHRQAVRASGVTLPHDYLAELGQRFSYVAEIMSAKPHDASIAAEWRIVAEYLSNYSEACRELLPLAPRPTRSEVESTHDRTPPLIRFDLLAALVTRAGAVALEDAGRAVAGWARDRGAPVQLSDDQVGWLQSLVDGVTVVDLAQQVGMSRRTLHRELAHVWEQLGVVDREAGLVRAAELGLVTTRR